MSDQTCGSTLSTSLAQFLVFMSPAAAALLSAIALWVASRARSTSADALSTSQAATSLSLLASPSHFASVEPGRHEAPQKPSSTTPDQGSIST
jgi:NO-binding membrane sensor protein with MHYT domain